MSTWPSGSPAPNDPQPRAARPEAHHSVVVSGDNRGIISLGDHAVNVVNLVNQPRRPGLRPLDVAADAVAAAAKAQWEKAAVQRRLLAPAPLEVVWSLSSASVAGPLAAALAGPGQRPTFAALPGAKTITEAFVQAGGTRTSLYQLYAGLPSGRLIIEGNAGSGKTGAGILLLLDALAHRESLGRDQRARVPVPLMCSLSGWDAETDPIEQWLVDQLTIQIPFLSGRKGRREAQALVQEGAISAILDGLDEIPEKRRAVVLEALSSARVRIVLLARTQELAQATTDRYFIAALAVHLEPIDPPHAADYLESCLGGPPPPGWRRLVDYLRHRPGSALAAALATPLAISLLRDTYRPDDDVSELPTIAEQGSAALEKHLLMRVVPAAYRDRAGQPPPRYSVSQAQTALAFVATRMNEANTQDLGWWTIADWASEGFVLVVSWITIIMSGVVAGFLAIIPALAWRQPIYLFAEAQPTVKQTLQIPIFTGLVAFLISFFAVIPVAITPSPKRTRRPSRRAAVGGTGASMLIPLGAWAALSHHLSMGLLATLLIAFMLGAAVWFGSGFGQPGVDDITPVDPVTTWRNDRRHAIAMGLATFLFVTFCAGLAMGLDIGSIYGSTQGSIPALEVGTMLGMPMGFVVGPGRSSVWHVRVACFQICHRRQSKPVTGVTVPLRQFLEDAYSRGVLRTLGPVYQFRHANLQDYLAGISEL